MNSKNPASRKRASLPRAVAFDRSFLQDWERLTHSGRYDLNRLKQVMMLLIANNGPLDAEWLDHPLKGQWDGHRECHAGGDFLLVYSIDERAKPSRIVFVRAGTHADLFE